MRLEAKGVFVEEGKGKGAKVNMVSLLVLLSANLFQLSDVDEEEPL
jgi:hypothetical protein